MTGGRVGVNPDLHPARSIGIAAVLVQAKDEAARARCLGQAEWLEFPAGTRTLRLLVGAVRGA
jgi:hypothetical protein